MVFGASIGALVAKAIVSGGGLCAANVIVHGVAKVASIGNRPSRLEKTARLARSIGQAAHELDKALNKRRK